MFRRKARDKQVLRKPPNGRKYNLSILCILVCLAGFGIAGLNPVYATLLSELVAGVLGVLFVYCTGNVGKSWVVGKKDSLTVSSEGANIQQGPPPSVGGM